MIDNVTNTLDSGELASALTALAWEDRILGKSETISLPVRCVWVTTANNPTMSTEIARRSIRIRLDPGVDRPWTLDGFKHVDLRKWADEYRRELVWSALVLIQNWIAIGMTPPTMKPLGSYEDWSKVIGGILEAADIPGFLANLHQFYEAADLEGAIWRTFVADWWASFSSKTVTVADLFSLARKNDDFELAGKSDRAKKISFGKQLARQRDRVLGGYRIAQAGKVRHAATWKLIPLTGSPVQASGGA